MTDVPLSDGLIQAVPLIPDGVTLKSGSHDEERFAQLFALGSVGCIPLNTQAPWMEPELASFLTQEAGLARYFLVHLACDFRPADDLRVSRAWIKIALQAAAPDGDRPLAWSMDPLRLSDKVEATVGAKLSGDATLFGAEINASEKTARDDHYVLAHCLQGSDPFWAFQERAQRRLEGVHRLKLVVRAPLGAASHGRVQIDATVQRRQFLFSRKAELPSRALGEFSLG